MILAPSCRRRRPMPSLLILAVPKLLSPPLGLKAKLPNWLTPPMLAESTFTFGMPSHWWLNKLNAWACNWNVARSVIRVFLKTARLMVLIGWPRSVFRPTPRNGEPKNFAALTSLTIQRTALRLVAPLVVKFVIPQSEAVGSVQIPTELKGALALPWIGRQVSSVPPVKSVGSQNPWPEFCTAVHG